MVPPQPFLTQNAPAQRRAERAEGEWGVEREGEVPAQDIGDAGNKTDAGRRPRPFCQNSSNGNRSEQKSRTPGTASALTSVFLSVPGALIGCN